MEGKLENERKEVWKMGKKIRMKIENGRQWENERK